MLFNAFDQTVKKFPNKLALNDLTYAQLHREIVSRQYTPVCRQTDWTIILDILKAASLCKPIIVLPKFHRETVTIPSKVSDKTGVVLFSSGSTGDRKHIFMNESMMLENAKVAIECQNITPDDKILTVCSMNHTGGISAQTIPGLLAGAHVIVESFNAFNMFRLINQHKITLTHLVPVMIDALKKVNSDADISSLRLVVAGSDCVYKQHAEFWLGHNIPFMVNYGLTEAGPMIINHIYTENDLHVFNKGVPIGTQAWCEIAFENKELLLKGLNVQSNYTWMPTGDCVSFEDGWFFYHGRISAGCKIVPKQY